jgi:hypothetical protein
MMQAFDVSVGVFVRGLTQLKEVLRKGEGHGVAPTCALVEGMQDLGAQVYWASEGARLALERVLVPSTGALRAPPPPSATHYAELHAKIDSVVAELQSLDPSEVEASLERVVELPVRGGPKSYRADRFLLELALPSFFFHLTLAYAILRKEGVALDKADFIGR